MFFIFVSAWLTVPCYSWRGTRRESTACPLHIQHWEIQSLGRTWKINLHPYVGVHDTYRVYIHPTTKTSPEPGDKLQMGSMANRKFLRAVCGKDKIPTKKSFFLLVVRENLWNTKKKFYITLNYLNLSCLTIIKINHFFVCVISVIPLLEKTEPCSR